MKIVVGLGALSARQPPVERPISTARRRLRCRNRRVMRRRGQAARGSAGREGAVKSSSAGRLDELPGVERLIGRIGGQLPPPKPRLKFL